jgi:hypothetical protein
MASDRKVLEFLSRSLENPHSDQLELCFWTSAGDQLVFA